MKMVSKEIKGRLGNNLALEFEGEMISVNAVMMVDDKVEALVIGAVQGLWVIEEVVRGEISSSESE